MRIKDYISRWLQQGGFLPDYGVFGNPYESKMQFGETLWHNVTSLVTSLINDVTFVRESGADLFQFAELSNFYNACGELILTRLYDKGFVVISRRSTGYVVLNDNEYETKYDADSGWRRVIAKDGGKVYVIKSHAYEVYGKSERKMCSGFIDFADNVLNASNTCSARLGALVVASPSSGSSPVGAVLNDKQKKELEDQISKDYGSLRRQRQIMVLPRSMDFQTISLAGIDARTYDKLKLAIFAMCDCVKVPANQVAIIAGTSAHSLSNGGELIEGDFQRYATFERLLNRSLIALARELGIPMTYTIYNKPIRSNG